MQTIGLIFGQAGTGAAGGLAAFLPMLLVLVIAYFLILRPQMKRQKEHTKMIESLDKGDKIVTAGGIHGTIVKSMDNNTVLVKISDEVKIVIDRSAIGRRESEPDSGNSLPSSN